MKNCSRVHTSSSSLAANTFALVFCGRVTRRSEISRAVDPPRCQLGRPRGWQTVLTDGQDSSRVTKGEWLENNWHRSSRYHPNAPRIVVTRPRTRVRPCYQAGLITRGQLSLSIPSVIKNHSMYITHVPYFLIIQADSYYNLSVPRRATASFAALCRKE